MGTGEEGIDRGGAGEADAAAAIAPRVTRLLITDKMAGRPPRSRMRFRQPEAAERPQTAAAAGPMIYSRMGSQAGI